MVAGRTEVSNQRKEEANKKVAELRVKMFKLQTENRDILAVKP